jgi:hypothetical protein
LSTARTPETAGLSGAASTTCASISTAAEDDLGSLDV